MGEFLENYVPSCKFHDTLNLVYTTVDFLMRTDNQAMVSITEKVNPQMEYGLSAAMAWSYFGIVAAVLGLLAAIISKKVYYYE